MLDSNKTSAIESSKVAFSLSPLSFVNLNHQPTKQTIFKECKKTTGQSGIAFRLSLKCNLTSVERADPSLYKNTKSNVSNIIDNIFTRYNME